MERLEGYPPSSETNKADALDGRMIDINLLHDPRPILDAAFGNSLKEMEEYRKQDVALYTAAYGKLREKSLSQLQNFIKTTFSVDGYEPTWEDLKNDAKEVTCYIHSTLGLEVQEQELIAKAVRDTDESTVDQRTSLIVDLLGVDERQLGIAYNCGVIRRRSHEYKLAEKVEDIDRVLHDNALKNAQTITLYGLHSNFTNKTHLLRPDNDFEYDSQIHHVKNHDFEMYECDIQGSKKGVYGRVREKSIGSTFVKLAKKSLCNGRDGRIDPNENDVIYDSIGGLFALEGNEEDAVELATKIVGSVDTVYHVKKVIPDHNFSSSTPCENKDVNYYRWQVWLEGWQVPFELIVYSSFEQLLNSTLEVRVDESSSGKRNTDISNDKINGRAHALYAQRRIPEVLTGSLNGHVHTAMKETANTLLGFNRVG